jgi:hypothetical protein
MKFGGGGGGKKKKKNHIIIKIQKAKKWRRKGVKINHTHIGTNCHNENDEWKSYSI